MNWSKLFKGKRHKRKENSEDAKLLDVAIVVAGHVITPAHNEKVLQNVVWEMQNKTIPENAKDTNIHVTNFYVYHSLKIGAEKMKIPFPWNPIELFFLIDLEDYGLIIDKANKTFGIRDEDFYSEKFKKLLN